MHDARLPYKRGNLTPRRRVRTDMQYASLAVGIVACPFCREMFEESEAETCPVCGMRLAPLAELPPSHDARAEDGFSVAPEEEELPASYMGRGKGVLGVLALVGLVLFFFPWIHVTLPDTFDMSGFDLARKLGWSWGAAVGWIILVPTVLSRRSIVKMRGARVAAATLSVVPMLTVAILLLKPPRSALVPIQLAYAPSIWLTLVVSAVAVFFSLRLGGPLDDLPVTKGTSAGQTLH